MHAVLRRARARLSFANVTSTLALFIALGGTSYAALQLPANSVGSREIRTGAVTGSEIKTGAVGSSEIKTGAVRSAEIHTDAVRANEIRANAVGADEIRGDGVTSSEIATDAVGADELRAGAVGTSEIGDGTVEAADLSPATRTSLTDANAVAFRAAVSSTGTIAAGTATSAARTATGEYTVTVSRDVSGCQFAATLAGVRSGTTLEAAPAGLVTATPGTANTTVVVRTFDPAGAALDAPFHLLIAC